MRGNPIPMLQMKQEFWNRNISQLFTSAKIVPIKFANAHYIETISPSDDALETRLIIIFYNDGNIRLVLQNSQIQSDASRLLTLVGHLNPSSNLEKQNENNDNSVPYFNSITKISEKFIVITNFAGNLFLISVLKNSSQNENDINFPFSIVSAQLPISLNNSQNVNLDSISPPFIIKYTEDKFIVIDSNFTATLCKVDGSTTVIWDHSQLKFEPYADQSKSANQDSESFICGTILDNFLIVLGIKGKSWIGLAYGIIEGSTQLSQCFDPSLSHIRQMQPYENGAFCLLSDYSTIISIDIENDEISQSPIFSAAVDKKGSKFDSSNIRINDIKVIDDRKTLLCLSSESILAYTIDIENHIAKAELNVDGCFDFMKFASTNSPRVFVAFASDNSSSTGKSNMYICRLNRKPEHCLEMNPITALLQGTKIIDSCPIDDFSFSTLSEDGGIVLWENSPEWWDVPFVTNLFS